MSKLPTRKNLYMPDINNFDSASLSVLGYTRLTVSLFDHWLTDEEAKEDCRMQYCDGFYVETDIAIELKKKRLLKFYKYILSSGAYRKTGRGRLNTGITWHGSMNKSLTKFISLSFDDVRYIDIFVPKYRVRVMGNWDGSDVLLFDSLAMIACLKSIINMYGLFLLEDI